MKANAYSYWPRKVTASRSILGLYINVDFAGFGVTFYELSVSRLSTGGREGTAIGQRPYISAWQTQDSANTS
jgi:hypothetical protein